MKTPRIFIYLSILSVLTFATSCSSDDDNDGVVTPQGFEGLITEDLTLDSSIGYTITSNVRVADGVTLTIPAGTVITSEAGTDNYLAVLKGGTIDIQGTATNPVVMQSDGSAGAWGGLLLVGDATTTEGVDATAEVGGLIYGGTNDTDSSGNIDYLIIRDAGAQITTDSQYNGLTLYAVGSGTTLDNIAIINGSDDGVEFFGGTVSITNLYLENNEDDAIDWTEGWNGSVNTAYVTNSIANFSTIVEADGFNNNPTINNLTAVTATGGLAIQIKNASGGTINGFSASGFDTLFDFPGTSTESALQIDGTSANADTVYTSSTTTASLFSWVNDALLNVTLPTNITFNTTLDPTVTYTINSSVLVNSGATLTIPAGTVITSEPGTDNYLAVLKGGQIDIQGTATNPVVMESDGSAGAWGGLLLVGDATTTEGVDATAEVGGLIYGGTNDTDSSGNIDYLIIRDAGAQITTDSQYNGLTLYAVGSGTTLDNIAIINGSDDGVEFFGGTVSITNLYLENNEDDAIDWTEGWNGSVNTAYVTNSIANFSTIVEADGFNNNPTINNLTAVTATGGLAIQIKNASGGTINGFSASGFDTLFDFPGTSTESALQIDGTSANADTAYASSTTVVGNFTWVN